MAEIFIYSFLSFILLLVASYPLLHSRRRFNNLPPSPISLPIVGHLHLLTDPLIHRRLLQLSQKYGPIFSLWFGSQLTVIISSQSAVDECFTKNDVVLANRPRFLMGKHLGYNHSNLIASPYGEHWRNLRRICALEIFSSSRLNLFLSIRKDEIHQLLRKLCANSSPDFVQVELKSLFSDLTFNIMMRMVAGKRYYGDDVIDEDEAKQFREIMGEIVEYAGASEPGDFVPILRWIDYQGFEKRLMNLGKKTDAFLQKLIDDNRSDLGSRNTMIDHLLCQQELQPEYYTDQIIKGLILVMLVAGTDTSAVTLEWAMSNLLNHRDILKNARDEIDTQVGQECLIDEPDISKLLNLQNIISETLRLYPAVPLLLPHMSSADCTIGGFNIPSGTMFLINAWAIHRDPQLWDESTKFKPERFTSLTEGQTNNKLMPFGQGRRACPGAPLANRILGLALGSLIQCFEWERVDEKVIEMIEGRGLTMPKAEPLVVLCKARPIMYGVLSQPVENVKL